MDDDTALDAHEHAEHAEHAAHSGDGFLRRVSITIAILAVGSAAISSLETNESASAIAASAEAVLHQDRATDQWSFFQAKAIKSDMYSIAADRGGPKAAFYSLEAKRHKDDQAAAQAQAESETRKSEESVSEQRLHERRHHAIGLAETLSHVAIAVATISIITRQRWPWLGSIGLGVLAAAATLLAYN